MIAAKMIGNTVLFLALLVGAAADTVRKESSVDHDLSASKNFLRKLSSIPTERNMAATHLDFSGFVAGDVVSDLGDGVTVVALKKTSLKSSFVGGSAMIFDSSNPTGGDEDLGTPNMAFGGPGVGNAGKKGKVYANKIAQGNVLMVSEDDNASNPDDNKFGGILHLYFDPPRFVNSIGLLDNDEGTVFTVTTADGGSSVLHDYSGGNNSYEDVAIGKPMVKELSVEFVQSGAISNIVFEQVSCPLKPIADFGSLTAGDLVSDLGNGVTVSAYTAYGDVAGAMVFDSSAPTGDDFDLGSPHTSFGGPGVGKAGKKGKLFANSVPQGKILIVSEDGDASDPDDSAEGGYLVFNFAKPTYVESIGLLDNDEQTLFTLTSKDGSISHFYNSNGGDNSFELVKLSKPAVIQLTVVFIGSGSITTVNTCA